MSKGQWYEFQLASTGKPACVGPDASMSVSVNGLIC